MSAEEDLAILNAGLSERDLAFLAWRRALLALPARRTRQEERHLAFDVLGTKAPRPKTGELFGDAHSPSRAHAPTLVNDGSAVSTGAADGGRGGGA